MGKKQKKYSEADLNDERHVEFMVSLEEQFKTDYTTDQRNLPTDRLRSFLLLKKILWIEYLKTLEKDFLEERSIYKELWKEFWMHHLEKIRSRTMCQEIHRICHFKSAIQRFQLRFRKQLLMPAPKYLRQTYVDGFEILENILRSIGSGIFWMIHQEF